MITPFDRRLDVARLLVVRIARQRRLRQTGSAPRARIATPFHADCPTNTAP